MSAYTHLEQDLEYIEKYRDPQDQTDRVFGKSALQRLRRRLEILTIDPRDDEAYENITEDIQAVIREFNRRVRMLKKSS